MKEAQGHVIALDLPEAAGSDFSATVGLASVEQIRLSCEILLDEMRRERQAGAYYELSLSVVDDASIREINREHRGKDAPTDVLSFPLLEEDGQGEQDAFITPTDLTHVGDLLISHETCALQAREIGHSMTDEFQRLLVHGLLHLFGYDHETSPEDEAVMRKREDELLALLERRGL